MLRGYVKGPKHPKSSVRKYYESQRRNFIQIRITAKFTSFEWGEFDTKRDGEIIGELRGIAKSVSF